MSENLLTQKSVSESGLHWPKPYGRGMVLTWVSNGCSLRPRAALTLAEADNLKKLCVLLSRPISFYPRAVAYMENLLSFSGGQRVQMPILNWLRRDMPARDPVRITTGNEEFEHLPQTSWRLTVKHQW